MKKCKNQVRSCRVYGTGRVVLENNVCYRNLKSDIYTLYGLCLAQSPPTVCDPVDCSPPGSSVHGDSPGKNSWVGCHALLQRIFPTHGSNPGLPHCRQILYHLSHQGSPCYGNTHMQIEKIVWMCWVLNVKTNGEEEFNTN